jgi:hypothetical protein
MFTFADASALVVVVEDCGCVLIGEGHDQLNCGILEFFRGAKV